VKEQVFSALHFLVYCAAITGSFVLAVSLRAFHKSTSTAGRVVGFFCILAGLALCGFALYMLYLSPSPPTK
jgi:hypothetical protein